MKSNTSFLLSAQQCYREINLRSLRWMLARSESEPWINTKFNPIELRDYTTADGLRGPGYVYGWIQGRALESLIHHARAIREYDQTFADTLMARSESLFQALNQLHNERGHASFCYDHKMRPICTTRALAGEIQQREHGLYTFSDLFVVKGLIAASAVHAPQRLDRYLAWLTDIIKAIEADQFVRDESAHITRQTLNAQEKDFGPRMIALGAASLLHSHQLEAFDTFSTRFVQEVLEQHTDSSSGLISNAPGGSTLNAGHLVELIGFHFETWGDSLPDEQINQLATLLTRTYALAFDGKGLRLTVDINAGCNTSKLCPWWSLPETIRAAALAFELTGETRYEKIWQQCHKAFFRYFWLDTPPIAVQMLADGSPVDVVPATPDLDPGYHTGLSLLTASNVAQRLSTSSNPS